MNDEGYDEACTCWWNPHPKTLKTLNPRTLNDLTCWWTPAVHYQP